MDVAVKNMIYTIFLKLPNFNYSYLGDVFLELVGSYKQMVARERLIGEILINLPVMCDIRNGIIYIYKKII